MDPVEDTLREVESLICGLDFEVAVGLDLNGRVLFWRSGDEDSVSPTPEEWALVQDKILTHNHPRGGGSLQTEDMFKSRRYGLRQVRAVTEEWIFIMDRPSTGWPPDAGVMDLTEPTGNAIHVGVAWEKRPEWARLFWHEMWLRISPKIGYKYSWRPMWGIEHPSELPTKPNTWPR